MDALRQSPLPNGARRTDREPARDGAVPAGPRGRSAKDNHPFRGSPCRQLAAYNRLELPLRQTALRPVSFTNGSVGKDLALILAASAPVARPYPTLRRSSGLSRQLVHALINALPDIVPTAAPYPLPRTRRRFFDDRPSVDIDIGRRRDAAPKYRIRFGGPQNKCCRKADDGNADQELSTHWFIRRTKTL